MASPSGSANGGIIGKTNTTSFGKCTVTIKKSGTSTITTQPGTRFANIVVVGGGGGSGGGPGSGLYGCGAGGGGAGGVVGKENL